MSDTFRWIQKELNAVERRISNGLLSAGFEVKDQVVKTVTRKRNLAPSPGPSGRVYRKPGAVGLQGSKDYLTIITTKKRLDDGTYVYGVFRVKAYRASKKGEAPATRTGNLAQHIAAGPVRKVGAVFVMEIGTTENAPYGRILEEAMHRPYFSRAIKSPAVINLAMNAFKKGFSS